MSIKINGLTLDGETRVPDDAEGLVVFAHGSASSRYSTRYQLVAQTLEDGGFGTFMFDLLSTDEERIEVTDGHPRFDTEGLGARLTAATDWIRVDRRVQPLPIAYFGGGIGAAAAIRAAVARPGLVRAVVCRSGRLDLADSALATLETPTLLVVGGADTEGVELNARAFHRMHCPKALVIVPGATHWFPDAGALEESARLAREWFARHLSSVSRHVVADGTLAPLGRDQD